MVVVDKSKRALHAAIETLLLELPKADTKTFTISPSKEIRSFISKDNSEAAPTIFALRHAMSGNLRYAIYHIRELRKTFIIQYT